MNSPGAIKGIIAALAGAISSERCFPVPLISRPRYSYHGVPAWPDRRSYVAARKAARKARRAR